VDRAAQSPDTDRLSKGKKHWLVRQNWSRDTFKIVFMYRLTETS